VNAELLTKIQAHEAYSAIGVSALRGQDRGTREAALVYLKRIDLSNVPKSSCDFKVWLDDQTECLRQKLPGFKPDSEELWGVARKALNLFLRSCSYNYHLRTEYGLEPIETLLETPLDSVAGKRLMEEAGKANYRGLPAKWPSLKRLKREQSEEFQRYAESLAKSWGLPARVFVDSYLWLGPHAD
jgi:hypothetical protein